MALLHEALRVSEVRDYNPDTGAQIIKTYRGTKAQIDTVESYWNLLNVVDDPAVGKGYRTTKTQTSDGYQIVVRIPDSQLYTETWAVDTETVTVPIWWNPDVKAYVPILAAINISTLNGLKNYIYRIGLILRAFSIYKSVANTNQAFFDVANDPVTLPLVNYGPISKEEIDIIMMMVRTGNDSMELKRPVAKRNRVIPRAVSGQTALVGRQQVFSTAGLVSLVTDSDVAAKIAAVEANLYTAPPLYTWGWKQRRNDSQTQVGYARTNECVDWVFGLWSKITHEIL